MSLKTFAANAAILLLLSSPVMAWELTAMNEQIDQTNFVIGEGRGHCSGTLISVEERLIVTAYHCIDGMIEVVTEDVPGEGDVVEEKRISKTDPVQVMQFQYEDHTRVGTIAYMTEIVGHNKSRDLAILKLRGDNLLNAMAAPLLPADGVVQRGEQAIAVGNPLMQDASVTFGHISSTTRALPWLGAKEVPFFQLSADIEGGSSGGALYNIRGEYIGTTVGAVPGTTMGIATPVYDLHDLLVKSGYAEAFGLEPAEDEAEAEAEDEDEDEAEVLPELIRDSQL